MTRAIVEALIDIDRKLLLGVQLSLGDGAPTLRIFPTSEKNAGQPAPILIEPLVDKLAQALGNGELRKSGEVKGGGPLAKKLEEFLASIAVLPEVVMTPFGEDRAIEARLVFFKRTVKDDGAEDFEYGIRFPPIPKFHAESGPFEVDVEFAPTLTLYELHAGYSSAGGFKAGAVIKVDSLPGSSSERQPPKEPEKPVKPKVDSRGRIQAKPPRGAQSTKLPPAGGGPSTPVFQLRYFGIGQRVGVDVDLNAENPIADLFASKLQKLNATTIDELLPLIPDFYKPERGWLIALDLYVKGFDVRVIFNDPSLYGLEISCDSGQFKGLDFEILYQRLGPKLGCYYGALSLPENLRDVFIGPVSIIIPSFRIWVYTNGDFRIAVGWPLWGQALGVQVLIFAGSLGFTFARLRSADVPNPPPADAGRDYNPILVIGLGMRLGLGRDFHKGPLSASIFLGYEGVFQGLLAWESEDGGTASVARAPDYYWFSASVGLIGQLQGTVDLVIASVSVEIALEATVAVAFETDCGSEVRVDADVSVKATVKIAFIHIHAKFHTHVSAKFTLFHGSNGRLAGTDKPSDPYFARFVLPAKSKSEPGVKALAAVSPLHGRRLARTRAADHAAAGGPLPSLRPLADVFLDAAGTAESPGGFNRFVDLLAEWLLALYGEPSPIPRPTETLAMRFGLFPAARFEGSVAIPEAVALLLMPLDLVSSAAVDRWEDAERQLEAWRNVADALGHGVQGPPGARAEGTGDGPARFGEELAAWIAGFKLDVTGVDLTAPDAAAENTVVFPMWPGAEIELNGAKALEAASAEALPETHVGDVRRHADLFHHEPFLGAGEGAGGKTPIETVFEGALLAACRTLAEERIRRLERAVEDLATLGVASDYGDASLASHVGGAISHFLLNGSRVPVPGSEPSRFGVWSEDELESLFRLTGQQLDVVAGQVNRAVLSLPAAEAPATAAIEVAAPTGLAPLKWTVAEAGPAPEDSGEALFVQRAGLRDQRHFVAVTHLKGVEPPLANGGTVLAQVPDALRRDYGGRHEKVVVHDRYPDAEAPADNAAQSQGVPAVFGLRIPLRVTQLPGHGEEGGPSAAAVYRISGADEATRDRILALIDAIKGGPLTATCALLIPTGGAALESAASGFSIFKTSLPSTTLSDGPHPAKGHAPVGWLLDVAPVPGQSPGPELLGPVAFEAGKSDPLDALLLLWECAVCHGDGFWLRYPNGGKGLAEDLFERGAAEVDLWVDVGPMPTIDLGWATSIAVQPQQHAATLYLEPPPLKRPAYPPGCVAFDVYWNPPAAPEKPATPYDAEQIKSLYRLLQYRVASTDASPDVHTGWSRAITPTTQRRGTDGSESTAFSELVPVARILQRHGLSAARTVSVELRRLDVFGDAMPEGSPETEAGAVDLPVVFNDPLIPICEWPKLILGYGFLPRGPGEQPRLAVHVMLPATATLLVKLSGLRPEFGGDARPDASFLSALMDDEPVREHVRTALGRVRKRYDEIQAQLNGPEVRAELGFRARPRPDEGGLVGLPLADPEGGALAWLRRTAAGIADFLAQLDLWLDRRDESPPEAFRDQLSLELPLFRGLAEGRPTTSAIDGLDLFELVLQVRLDRVLPESNPADAQSAAAERMQAALVRGLPEILHARASVPPWLHEPAEGKANSSDDSGLAALKTWAREFEAALDLRGEPGAGFRFKLAKRSKRADQHETATGSGELWAVRFRGDDADGAGLDLTPEGGVEHFAMRPLSTRLENVGGKASPKLTALVAALPQPRGGVDVDRLCEGFLATVDALFEPTTAAAIAVAEPELYASLLGARATLAELLAERLIPVFPSPGGEDDGGALGSARATFEVAVLDRLSRAYQISTISQVKLRSMGLLEASRVPPRLFGGIVSRERIRRIEVRGRLDAEVSLGRAQDPGGLLSLRGRALSIAEDLKANLTGHGVELPVVEEELHLTAPDLELAVEAAVGLRAWPAGLDLQVDVSAADSRAVVIHLMSDGTVQEELALLVDGKVVEVLAQGPDRSNQAKYAAEFNVLPGLWAERRGGSLLVASVPPSVRIAKGTEVGRGLAPLPAIEAASLAPTVAVPRGIGIAAVAGPGDARRLQVSGEAKSGGVLLASVRGRSLAVPVDPGDSPATVGHRLALLAMDGDPRLAVSIAGGAVDFELRQPAVALPGDAPLPSFAYQIALTVSVGESPQPGTVDIALAGGAPVAVALSELTPAAITAAMASALDVVSLADGAVLRLWLNDPRVEISGIPSGVTIAVEPRRVTAIDVRNIAGADQPGRKLQLLVEGNPYPFETDAEKPSFADTAQKLFAALSDGPDPSEPPLGTLLEWRERLSADDVVVPERSRSLLLSAAPRQEDPEPSIRITGTAESAATLPVRVRDRGYFVEAAAGDGPEEVFAKITEAVAPDGLAATLRAVELRLTPRKPTVTVLPAGYATDTSPAEAQELTLTFSVPPPAEPPPDKIELTFQADIAVTVDVTKVKTGEELPALVVEAFEKAGSRMRLTAGSDTVAFRRPNGRLQIESGETGLGSALDSSSDGLTLSLFGALRDSGSLRVLFDDVVIGAIDVADVDGIAGVKAALLALLDDSFAAVTTRVRVAFADATEVDLELDQDDDSATVGILSGAAAAGCVVLRVGAETVAVNVKAGDAPAHVAAALSDKLRDLPQALAPEVQVDAEGTTVVHLTRSAALEADTDFDVICDLPTRAGALTIESPHGEGGDRVIALCVTPRTRASAAGRASESGRLWVSVSGTEVGLDVEEGAAGGAVLTALCAKLDALAWPLLTEGRNNARRARAIVAGELVLLDSVPGLRIVLESEQHAVTVRLRQGADEQQVATAMYRSLHATYPELGLGLRDRSVLSFAVHPDVQPALAFELDPSARRLRLRGASDTDGSFEIAAHVAGERVSFPFEYEARTRAVDLLETLRASIGGRAHPTLFSRVVGDALIVEQAAPSVESSTPDVVVDRARGGREVRLTAPRGRAFEASVEGLRFRATGRKGLSPMEQFQDELRSSFPDLGLTGAAVLQGAVDSGQAAALARLENRLLALPESARISARWIHAGPGDEPLVSDAASVTNARMPLGVWASPSEVTLRMSSPLTDELTITQGPGLAIELDPLRRETLILRGRARAGERFEVSLRAFPESVLSLEVQPGEDLFAFAERVSEEIAELLLDHGFASSAAVQASEARIEVMAARKPAFAPDPTVGGVTVQVRPLGGSDMYEVTVRGAAATGEGGGAIAVDFGGATGTATVRDGDSPLVIASGLLRLLREIEPPRVSWAVTAQRPSRQTKIVRDESFFVDTIEHAVDFDHERFGYQPGHSLEFIDTESSSGRDPSLVRDLGVVETPILEHTHPPVPGVETAGFAPTHPEPEAGTLAAPHDATATIMRALLWEYDVRVRSAGLDAQDDLIVVNTFNLAAGTTLAVPLEPLPELKYRALFDDLLTFASAVGDAPQQIAAAGRAGTPPAADSVKNVVGAIEGVIETWSGAELVPLIGAANTEVFRDEMILRCRDLYTEGVLDVMVAARDPKGLSIVWPSVTLDGRAAEADDDTASVPAPSDAPTSSHGKTWWRRTYRLSGEAPAGAVRSVDVRWSRFDLLTRQTVLSAARVVRNADVAADRAARPVDERLQLKTPWVHRGHPVVPRMKVKGLEVNFGQDLYSTLYAILEPFAAESSHQAGALLKVAVAHTQAVGRPDDTAFAPRLSMPVTLQNGLRIRTGDDPTALPSVRLDELVRELTENIVRWHADVAPRDHAPEIKLDVTLFSEGDANDPKAAGADQLPLLELLGLCVTALPVDWARPPLNVPRLHTGGEMAVRSFPDGAHPLAGLLLQSSFGKEARTEISTTRKVPKAKRRRVLAVFSLGERFAREAPDDVDPTNIGGFSVMMPVEGDDVQPTALALDIPRSQRPAAFDVVASPGTPLEPTGVLPPEAWDSNTRYYFEIIEDFTGATAVISFAYGVVDPALGFQALRIGSVEATDAGRQSERVLSLSQASAGDPRNVCEIILRSLEVDVLQPAD